MADPARHSTPPIELPPRPVREPAPVEGCPGCAELASLRARARAGGDMTTVSDCNVLLRRHPAGHR